MPVVGLTGGIASGKSTVCGFFKEAGACILDADQMARQVVMPGEPAWREIVDLFGRQVLSVDGSLDRTKLGDIVFGDAGRRKALERIIHPRVRQAMDSATAGVAAARPEALIIQDVPLLLETGMHQGLAEIIVVHVPEEVQIERLVRRDGMGREQALRRIRAQMPLDQKRSLATILIDNSGSLERTREQVLRIFGCLAGRKGTESPDADKTPCKI
ncbi:MAG: dephospho-CoA kinase [Desulfosarcinaceae bacterium]